jgi:hypothetical protein
MGRSSTDDTDIEERTLHVSLNFDDLQFDPDHRVRKDLDEAAIEAAMLRAGVDWIAFTVTDEIRVRIWRGEIVAIVLEDVRTALDALEHRPPLEASFCWAEAYFSLWLEPRGDRVLVVIEQFFYPEGHRRRESREMSIEACASVWKRMSLQLEQGLTARSR